MISLKEQLHALRERSDEVLDRMLAPVSEQPATLHEAMRYCAIAPGKRLRPVLTYVTGQALGAELAVLDRPAAAVELIHAYSLVHDDLPAMDDDDLRRGRPTCHKAFDEATAILVGDALQSLAFEILSGPSGKETMSPQAQIEMLALLAQASGSRGMCGGQAMDLEAVAIKIDLEALETIHLYKTGALIRCAVLLGYLASGHNEPQLRDRLEHYARCIGLAFQVQDDILDVEGDTAVIGKPQGSDSAADKPTYPEILGMARAKQAAQDLCDEAIANVKDIEGSGVLQQIAAYIVARDR